MDEIPSRILLVHSSIYLSWTWSVFYVVFTKSIENYNNSDGVDGQDDDDDHMWIESSFTPKTPFHIVE